MGCACMKANDSQKAIQLKKEINARKTEKMNTAKREQNSMDNEEGASQDGEAAGGNPNAQGMGPARQQYQVNFRIQDLSTMQDQTQLEHYLYDAVVAGQQQSIVDILNYNQLQVRETAVQGRDTTTSAAGRLDFEQKQRQPYIADVARITLERRFAGKQLVIKTEYKTFGTEETALWNPLLIMIAMKQSKAVEKLIMTRGAKYLHFAGCLSKPYSKQRQAEKAFPYSKRIKRECFGLKLAIYNTHEDLLSFLINGAPNTNYDADCDQLSQVWNLGHILQVIRLIIKVEWTNGLRKLFQLGRVKHIIKSVNDPQSFVDFLSSLIELFFVKNSITTSAFGNPQMQTELLACFDQEPYNFAKVFLGLYLQLLPDTVQDVVANLERTAIPFFKSEVRDIFITFDPQNLHSDVEKQLLTVCDETIQGASEDDMKEAVLVVKFFINDFAQRSKALQQGQKMEQESIDKIIDDLDALKPFGCKKFRDALPNENSNIVNEVLECGDEQILEYVYSSASEFNVRSLMICASSNQGEQNNSKFRFEVAELVANVPNLQVSLNHFLQFFQHTHFIEKFKFSLIYQMDQMNLHSVQLLLFLIGQDEQIGNQNRILLFGAILNSSKFRSLFSSSLEMEKHGFVARLQEIVEDQECFDARYMERLDTKRLHEIAYKENAEFQPYLEAIKKGNKGNSANQQELQRRSNQPLFRRHVIDPAVIHGGSAGLHPSVSVNNITYQGARKLQNPQANQAAAGNGRKQRLSINVDSGKSSGASNESNANKRGAANQSQQRKKVVERLKEGSNDNALKGSMALDMNVLTKQQNNQFNPDVQESKNSSEDTPSEKNSNFLNQSQNEKLSISDNVSNQEASQDEDGLAADDIQIQFEELKKVQICSEISIAYAEVLEGFKTGSLEVDDVHEVLGNYYLNPFEHIQINWSQYFDDPKMKKTSGIHPDKYLWSLFLYAIYYNQQEVVESFLTSEVYKDRVSPVAILRPPSNNQEFHIMDQKYAKHSQVDKIKDKTYNQTAIQLAVNNQNHKIFSLLLEKFQQCFTCADLCEISEILIGFNEPQKLQWQDGMKRFLKAAVTKRIFVHLRPEDKELFIAKSMIEPIVKLQQSDTEGQNAQAFLKMLAKELKSAPYNAYCALRYPNLYQKYGILDKGLANISDDDIIVFISANEENLQKLTDFSNAWEQKKQQKHLRVREILRDANDKKANGELIKPNDPRALLKFIQQGEPQEFIKYFEALKSKSGIKDKNDASEQGYASQRSQFLVDIEDVQLFRYLGHQLQQEEQIHEVDYIPQDEAIQQLLYDIDEETLSQKSASMDSEEQHFQLLNKLKQKVIQTESWNPLVFAIYFGQQEIVQYILDQTDQQQLYYLLSDPFRVEEENEDGDLDKQAKAQQDGEEDAEASEFLLERSELLSLVLCLFTKNTSMFSLLWDHPLLWNKQIYLILLGNFVFETQTPALIRAFLLSSKTQTLFNSISLCEKQKFIQFTIKSLEQQIVEEEDSQFGQDFNNSNDEEEQQAIRNELERILNVEMLSQPPYSLVNLTENLLPLNLDSTYEDLLALIEQYQKSAESRQILELTLKNLQGGLDTPAYGQKWVMINTNQIWAKKLTNLIEEVAEEEPEVFEKFKSLEWLQMDVFKEILNFNEA